MIPDRPISGAAAWLGADQAGSRDWVHRLSADEVAELESAAVRLQRSGRPLAELTAADFAMPFLEVSARAWLDEIERGRGFLLVRGVPVEGRSVEVCSLMYWGLGALLGTAVSQNAGGDLLGHVRNTGADPKDPSVRLYKTRERLGFHTDGADIIGLLCLRGAQSGGASRIASSVTVFNQVLQRRPDLAPLMFEPFPFDRNQEQADGEAPYFEFPLCAFDGEHLRTFYIGWYIRDSQRHPQAPRLTREQHELLDLIDDIASSPDTYLEMDFQPGDVQLLKNSVILHARTEFEDDPDPALRRHLLRLWLTGHRDLAGGDALLQGGIPRKEGVTGDAAG